MLKNFLCFILSAIFLVGLSACSTTEQADTDQQAVMSALNSFVTAFENGDLAAMEASFAEDATDFPRTIMSSDLNSPINIADYKRVQGIDPQMKQLVAMWIDSGSEPPYLVLNPLDLEIQMFMDSAIVTFHLLDGDALSRRTFVFAKRADEWKIVHLHASNVVNSE